jgi:vacuolar-type H+-ATPase subunit F/Vma7
MGNHLREAINDVVVKYLERKLQADEPVNVVAMTTEVAQSLVDMIMEQDEHQRAPLLASIIVTLGDEYLLRHKINQAERRDD